MGAKGWLCPTQPKEYGDMESSEIVGFMIREELAYADGPFSLIGASMAAPLF